MPPRELTERLGEALKLAERRAREQFYDREDAWAEVSRKLYTLSMEEIQIDDEDFSRLLLQKHGVDPVQVRHQHRCCQLRLNWAVRLLA